MLSDEEKRQTYDRFGKSAVDGSAGGGGHPGFNAHNAEDIFQAFFGGQDPFNVFFQGGGMQGAGPQGFGQRVHVSQFGPGFTFTSFGGPGMRTRHPMHPGQQRYNVASIVYFFSLIYLFH